MHSFNRLAKLLFTLVCLVYVSIVSAASMNSPIGFWKTIDDVTGKPKSILQIYEASDHTLSGRVMQIFPKPGEDPNKLCEACKGAKHNQPIVGMVILENMKQRGEKWDGGQILDPKNGKTYRCTLKVVNGGTHLEVHGYIGISLLGRTQTWIRVEKPN